MRYRLRTLLILLAIGVPLLAGYLWWENALRVDYLRVLRERESERQRDLQQPPPAP